MVRATSSAVPARRIGTVGATARPVRQAGAGGDVGEISPTHGVDANAAIGEPRASPA